MAQDWRDERIAELEAALAASEARHAAKDARIAEFEQRVAELNKQRVELTEKLGQNSRNSHRPPSSDPPAARGQRQGKGKSKSQRKRGAQPGHRPAQRGLLPPEEVDEVVHLFPSHCEGCAKPLPEVPDAHAMRFQVTEVPQVKPHTTEYRRHAVRCSCGHRTCAVHDQQPASPFGPRLMALVALLTGGYHLSRRKAAELLSDLAGDYTGLMFEYWRDYRDGKLTRERFVAWMAPLRQQVLAALQRAVDAQLAHVSGSCADLLAHAAALWTFVDRDGVPPTNHHAEQEIRAFVLWRKRSFGTQSERGNLFAERLMTVAHTARKQRRHVLTFLTACCQALLDDSPSPSLFDAPKASDA